MTTIHCRIEGCLEVFNTDQPVAANATFICRFHPKAVQMAAVGREYNPGIDDEDSTIRFQPFQFDKELDNTQNGKKKTASDIELDDTSDLGD